MASNQHDNPSVPEFERLKKSIVDTLPYCSGFLPAKSNELDIYYDKGEHARRLTLYRPSESSLEHLVHVCEPASFGRGKENVYDDSYRKAGKLGSDSFLSMLDVNATGLLSLIRDRLLGGSHENKCIRAELYNLNIYNEGSFFKSHVDTPRGENMFGSLVIFYPIAHEGGTLVMRKNGQEWSFDTSKVLAEDQGPRFGYVALYSDVEHEVLPVTSGHRISITYNLYFDLIASKTLPIPQSSASSVFKSTLTEFLDDPKFLPEGGILGFGLEYAYPSHTSPGHLLHDLQTCLKGVDLDIMQACKELSLETSLWTIINWETQGGLLACKGRVPEFENRRFRRFDKWLFNNFGAMYLKHDDDRINVTWVKSLPEERWHKQSFFEYDEPDCAYHTVCLLVEVGKPGQRDTPLQNEATAEAFDSDE